MKITETRIKGKELIDLSAGRLMELEESIKHKDKEIERLISGQLNTSRLLDAMKSSAKALPAVKINTAPARQPKMTEEDQILLLSDLHAGEVIRPEEIDGFNQYNYEIMCSRLWHLQETVLQLSKLQSSVKIKRLWVFSLGDLVTGEIHNMAETNEFPILKTIIQTAFVLSQMLMRLASQYEEVIYVGVSGNHDRRHEKPRTKMSDDNWGTILNYQISLHCVNQPNIKFLVPKSPFLIVEVRGKKCLVRHGHGLLGGSFAGVPFYGLSRKHSAFQELYRNRGGIDYEFFGHYHQSVVLKDDRVYINGSVIGANEFAVNALAAYCPPSQKLLGICDKHGVTYTYRIDLSNADDTKHGYVYNKKDVFEHKAMMCDFISRQFGSKRKR